MLSNLLSHPPPNDYFPQHFLHTCPATPSCNLGIIAPSLKLTAKAPENRPKPNRKGSHSNHPFLGPNWLLVSGRVPLSEQNIWTKLHWHLYIREGLKDKRSAWKPLPPFLFQLLGISWNTMATPDAGIQFFYNLVAINSPTSRGSCSTHIPIQMVYINNIWLCQNRSGLKGITCCETKEKAN